MRDLQTRLSSRLVLAVLAGFLAWAPSAHAQEEAQAQAQAQAQAVYELAQRHRLGPGSSVSDRREQAIRELSAGSALLAAGAVLVGFGADAMQGDPYRKVAQHGDLNSGTLGLGLLVPGLVHLVPAVVLFIDGMSKYQERSGSGSPMRWSLTPYFNGDGSGLVAAGRF